MARRTKAEVEKYSIGPASWWEQLLNPPPIPEKALAVRKARSAAHDRRSEPAEEKAKKKIKKKTGE